MALSQDTATPRLDAIMERASQRLVAMDYAVCEWGCLTALAVAREAGLWRYYARILLPLQEARRQRRMIAGDAEVVLCTSSLPQEDLLRREGAAEGCLVFAMPADRADAGEADVLADLAGLSVEVLWLDHEPDVERAVWRVCSPRGPRVCVDVPPMRVNVSMERYIDERVPVTDERVALRWFESAAEAVGDAAIASVTAELGSLERVDQLERMLDAARTHEKLHQRLAEAALALALRTRDGDA